jgi:hypothetical protein
MLNESFPTHQLRVMRRIYGYFIGFLGAAALVMLLGAGHSIDVGNGSLLLLAESSMLMLAGLIILSHKWYPDRQGQKLLLLHGVVQAILTHWFVDITINGPTEMNKTWLLFSFILVTAINLFLFGSAYRIPKGEL